MSVLYSIYLALGFYWSNKRT